jgi:hypothetical protein
MQRKLLGIINVAFHTSGPLLIKYSAFVSYLREKWEYNEVYQLFIDFQKTDERVRREVLYSILSEYDIPMKLLTLIKMCLIET